MYITTDKRLTALGAVPTPPRLQPRCYSLMLTMPPSYAALEEEVRRWISTCVMSRTQVSPGVSIRRERPLVIGNPSLQDIWNRILQHRKGQRIEIKADYVWGPYREEAINFSTTALPPPPAPRPAPPAPGPAPCPPLTCAPVGSIIPSRHGFKFVNSFSLPIPLPGLPFLPGLPSSIPASFGLCGGMATAALDYYLKCIPVPSRTTIPTQGDNLFNYLVRRQLDSLDVPGFGMVLKFLEWTNRPDTTTRVARSSVPAAILSMLIGPLTQLITLDGLQELTAPEFRATTASLAAGSPVVLGLIYVGPGAVNIWHNHQVLAYGVTNVSANVKDIKIYDPNYPGDDTAIIRCIVQAGGTRVLCQQDGRGGTKTVRGFFRMPYTRRTPPCLP